MDSVIDPYNDIIMIEDEYIDGDFDHASDI